MSKIYDTGIARVCFAFQWTKHGIFLMTGIQSLPSLSPLIPVSYAPCECVLHHKCRIRCVSSNIEVLLDRDLYLPVKQKLLNTIDLLSRLLAATRFI